MRRVLYWFRSDLRLENNPAFQAAAADADELIPVFVVDHTQLSPCQFGMPRLGRHRLQFLLESLADLQTELRARDSDLIILRGDPLITIRTFYNEHACTQLVAQCGAAWEEQEQERQLAACCKASFFWNDQLFHTDDLPFALTDTTAVFTKYRRKVEAECEVRATVEAPDSLPPLPLSGSDTPRLADFGLEAMPIDPRAVLSFVGGGKAGRQRLHYYLWQKDLIASYKETRNGLIGGDYSSKFSPWLAHGCLSPRTIYHEIRRYEAEVTANDSTYWLIFELIWRDFFHAVAFQHGAKLFHFTGIGRRRPPASREPAAFRSWCNGETGQDFVDANMRELNATGFMSNRGRQIVASWLIHELGLDWRLGAAYFEYRLIDYDPCSNWGNWAYIAGVGNDPRGGRAFNVERQQDRYDSDASYRDLWLS